MLEAIRLTLMVRNLGTTIQEQLASADRIMKEWDDFSLGPTIRAYDAEASEEVFGELQPLSPQNVSPPPPAEPPKPPIISVESPSSINSPILTGTGKPEFREIRWEEGHQGAGMWRVEFMCDGYRYAVHYLGTRDEPDSALILYIRDVERGLRPAQYDSRSFDRR